MQLKAHSRSGRCNAGWSAKELLVVLGVVGILAALIWPLLVREREKARRITCVNNLKQISTGYRLLQVGSDLVFPDSYFSRTNSEGAESLWRLFQISASQFGLRDPRRLICPEDYHRKPAGDFLPENDPGFSSNSFSHPSLRNQALSYFYALGADEGSPQRLLLGDRNLTRNPKAYDKTPGNVLLIGAQDLGSAPNDKKDVRWSTDLHDRAGNVAFMDGSVQQLTSPKLREALRNSGDKINRIWLPN